MYKEASKQRLRFNTQKGLLTVEQLWQLSIQELDKLAVYLEEEYKEVKGTKTFLATKTEEDETAKLRFDIALDILNTKLKESEANKTAFETKAHNQKILGIIERKKEQGLEEMSAEELKKLLK